MNDINFVEVDSEKITRDLINHFEEYTGESLPIGDARRQFLQGMAYVIVMLFNSIDITGKGNLLRYATGAALDALGELFGVKRLDAEPSTVTLKFTLSNAQATSVTIPQGTRATADGKIFFATNQDLEIPSGGTNGTVTATATVAGEIGNGFVAGQITSIVDGVAYVGAVINTTDSANGRDIESDDDLRERIRIAPFSFSTAGAEEAYKYLALSSNVNIGDVQAFSESAGTVNITVVKKDGTLPEVGDEILTDVENACNAKTARPLTDNVIVSPATPILDMISIEYYISAEDSARADSIQEAVNNAVAEYKLWQTTKIGRDINPDRLRKLVLNAGADSVTINTPTAQAINDGEVAQFSTVDIAYKGLKE